MSRLPLRVPRGGHYQSPEGWSLYTGVRAGYLCIAGSRGVVTVMLSITVIFYTYYRKEFYSALDLPCLLQNHLLASRTAHHHSASLADVYWKLVLLHPPPQEMEEGDRNALHWISSKLCLSHDPTPPMTDREGPQISLSTSSTPLSFNPSNTASNTPLMCTLDPRGREVRLCVRGMSVGVQGLDLEQKRRAIQGVCSLVMFVPAPQDATTPPQVGPAVLNVAMEPILISLCVDVHVEYVEQCTE